VADPGDVVDVGGEEEPRLLEADLLLELDRARRGDGLARLLSARPSWRTVAPWSPVRSRQTISRSISGARIAASGGWSSRRNMRTAASTSASGASLTAMPDGVPPGAGGRIPALAAKTALGRLGEPDDVGAVIATLLGDDCRWITAQTIDVSGGFEL
jgi:Enoyl-(Acyl carrier protein) reductase